jgi:hypothetical protein
MKNNQLAGLVVLVLVVLGLGALTYYTYGLGNRGTESASVVAKPPAPADASGQTAGTGETPATAPNVAAAPAGPEQPIKDESRLG